MVVQQPGRYTVFFSLDREAIVLPVWSLRNCVTTLNYLTITSKSYRQELSRLMHLNRTTICRCKVERGDVIALFNLRRYPEAPVATRFECGQTRIFPGTRGNKSGPRLGFGPDNRQHGTGMPDFFRYHVYDALGTFKRPDTVGIPVDGTAPREHHCLTRFKIRNEQANPAVILDVAQRVEKRLPEKSGKESVPFPFIPRNPGRPPRCEASIPALPPSSEPASREAIKKVSAASIIRRTAGSVMLPRRRLAASGSSLLGGSWRA